MVGAFGAATASADTGELSDRGVFVRVEIDGDTYDGTQVLDTGSTLTMDIDYTAGTVKGGTYEFTVADGAEFTIDETALKQDNPVIDTIDTSQSGKVTITFKDDWGDTTSGSFHMDFTLAEYTTSEKTTVEWGVGGNSTSIDVIVRAEDDNFAPTEEFYQKSVADSPIKLDDYFELDNGTVTPTSASLDSAQVTYTLTATTPFGADFSDGGLEIPIQDTLDPLLVLDPASFDCSVVEWDDDGLNEAAPTSCTFDVATSTEGDSDIFSGAITATKPSTYTITYTAHIDPSIQQKLQAFVDDQGYLPGDYSSGDLDNSATFGDNEDNTYTAPVEATWKKAGVVLEENTKNGAVVDGKSLSCVKYEDQIVDASGCEGLEIDYTVTYSAAFDDAKDITVTDTLPQGMSYVLNGDDDVALTIEETAYDTSTYEPGTPTSWSATETPTTNSDSNATFSTGLSVPAGPTTYTIAYRAVIDDATVFQAALQDSFDALGNGSGGFSTGLKNTAQFSDKGVGPGSASHTAKLSGDKAGLVQSGAFGKTVDWKKTLVTDNGSGDLPDDLPIVYTLTADLSDTPSSATANVVIEDTLPNDKMEWGAIAAASDSVGITSLTEYTSGTCERTDFQTHSSPGDYCIDGRTLLINVGKDSGTKAVITANASITGVHGAGQDVGNPPYPEGTKQYSYENTANFYYGASNPIDKSVTSDVYVRPVPGDDGWDVPDVFDKSLTGASGEIVVQPGESADIDYTFTVGAGQDIDVATSTITDYIDADIFDLPTDLSDVIRSAKYKGASLADPDGYFDVSQDDDGNLLITVKPDKAGSFSPAGEAFELTITLTTKPFEGKESKTIVNKAVLEGVGEQETYHSSVERESTSYGNEAELRKRIYDTETGEWVTDIDAVVGSDGNLVGPFIYRLEFVAHGTYGTGSGAAISPIDDVLPAGMTFLSFIDESDIGSANFDTAVDAGMQSDETLGGNLKISHDDGTVTLEAKDGNRFIRGASDDGRYAAYFAVEVENTSEAVVNTLGGSSAVIHPLYPSINLEKWTVEDDSSGPEYDEAGRLTNDREYVGDFDDPNEPKAMESSDETITLTVSNDGTETLVDIALTDNILAGAGTISGIDACDIPEKLAPGARFSCDVTLSGVEAGQLHSDNAKVTAKGKESRQDVSDDDNWHGMRAPHPSIVVEKWTDEGEDSGPLFDEDGVVINDGYLGDFDDADHPKAMDSGDQIITLTVSNDGNETLVGIELADETLTGLATVSGLGECAIPEELAPGEHFECTVTLSGVKPGEFHSDEVTVNAMGKYSEEPVSDDDQWHGFVKSYAIGDYTWIDSNKDGIQDDDEPVLEGVTVNLLQDGVVIDTTTTDSDGWYAFDNLAAGDYQVQFVLTEEQAAKYTFTRYNAGGNAAVDSDAGENGYSAIIRLGDSNTALTKNYTDFDRTILATEGIDPTWDAGVILLEPPVEEEVVPPADVGPSDDVIPSETAPDAPAGDAPGDDTNDVDVENTAYTGVDAYGMVTVALLLLLAGGVALVLGRVSRQRALGHTFRR